MAGATVVIVSRRVYLRIMDRFSEEPRSVQNHETACSAYHFSLAGFSETLTFRGRAAEMCPGWSSRHGTFMQAKARRSLPRTALHCAQQLSRRFAPIIVQQSIAPLPPFYSARLLI